MAAKKTVYVSSSGGKVTLRRTDVEKMKRAFTKMMDEYVRLKQQQKKFEASAHDLSRILWPWSIPWFKIESWQKELRRR